MEQKSFKQRIFKQHLNWNSTNCYTLNLFDLPFILLRIYTLRNNALNTYLYLFISHTFNFDLKRGTVTNSEGTSSYSLGLFVWFVFWSDLDVRLCSLDFFMPEILLYPHYIFSLFVHGSCLFYSETVRLYFKNTFWMAVSFEKVLEVRNPAICFFLVCSWLEHDS